MSYARLDEGLPEHPKWAPLTDAAFRLGIRSICWARKPERQRKRPGFIPASMLVNLARRPPAFAARLAEELMRAGAPMYECGIWEPTEGGWLIHDFHEYGAATIQQEPAVAPSSKAEAGRRGGLASAEARRAQSGSAQPSKQPEANSAASAEATRSSLEADAEAASKQTLDQPVRSSEDLPDLPDPDRIPPIVPQPPLPEADSKQADGSAAERVTVKRVFEAWKQDTGHFRAILDKKRGRRILARVREGFTYERMLLAIRNRRNDPWLMGQGDSPRVFDDVDVLLRDAAQVERLERLTEPLKSSPANASQNAGASLASRVRQLEDEAAEAGGGVIETIGESA